MGHWPEKGSIFRAFVEELKEINAMAGLMGREPLFREDFAGSTKPRKFGFLIRPTLSEYNGFVHLLDKLMSDNLNVAFFRGDVELEVKKERRDGSVVVERVGTIQLLENWIQLHVKLREPEPIAGALSTFRKVRKLRQAPAHAINENVFNQKYFREQRALVIEAYKAVRTIRLLLSNHPLVKGHKVEEWLLKGEIWTY